MHLSIVTHGRFIGDYHAQHPFVAYTLHDRAGTLASSFIGLKKGGQVTKPIILVIIFCVIQGVTNI